MCVDSADVDVEKWGKLIQRIQWYEMSIQNEVLEKLILSCRGMADKEKLKIKNLSLKLHNNNKEIGSTQIYLASQKAFLKNLVNNNTLESTNFQDKSNLFLEVTYQTDNNITETTNIKLNVKKIKTLFK